MEKAKVFVYIPCMDSINFIAGGRGRGYGIYRKSELDVKNNYLKVHGVFSSLNSQESNYIGILTLNQICDNKLFWYGEDDSIFNLLVKLIDDGKIILSTYGEYDIIKYIWKIMSNAA